MKPYMTKKTRIMLNDHLGFKFWLPPYVPRKTKSKASPHYKTVMKTYQNLHEKNTASRRL